jgi:hypothetical protein
VRRFLALALAVACLAWIPPAAAEVGPTLHGEVLSQHTELVGPLTTPSCEDAGTTSMELSFSAGSNSRALGPIPGVFTLGAVSSDVGPPGSIQSMGLFPDSFDPGTGPDDFVPARPLEFMSASFDIEPTQPSAITLVEVDGLLEDDGLGACALFDGSGAMSANGYYQDVRAFGGFYEAVIYTDSADFVDFGTMDLQGRQGLICSGVVPDFAAGSCPTPPLSETNDLGVHFTSERDTDEDGVIDALDVCPEGAGSGSNGCPVQPPPPPPPPPLDSDGDGKPDNADDCPGRPGQTPSGCPDAYPPDDTKPRLSGKARPALKGSRLRIALGRFSEDVSGKISVSSGSLKLTKSFKARPGQAVTVSFKLKRKTLRALRRQRRVKLTVKLTARDPAGNTMSRTLKLGLRP